MARWGRPRRRPAPDPHLRRSGHRIGLGLIALVVLVAGSSLTLPNRPAQAVTASAAAQHGPQVLCRPRQWEYVDDRRYVIEEDYWGFRERLCLLVTAGPGFLVTRSVTPTVNWQGYPKVFSGCEYRICTRGSMPARVSSIRLLRETLWTRDPGQDQISDDANDVWFSKTNPGDSPRHPNGAEIMLWLSWHHVGEVPDRYVRLDGFLMFVDHWVSCDTLVRVSWQYTQFRILRHRVPSVTSLNFLPILRWCEARGYLRPSWWMSSFDAGFEVVQNGRNDRVLRFRLSIRVAR